MMPTTSPDAGHAELPGLHPLLPDWDAPASVHALCTTRLGGVSRGVYASLNLAGHVGDEVAHVERNRSILRTACRLPSEPRWLDQVHGCTVADADATAARCRADAVVAHTPGQICAVMTADCLPVLLCEERGVHVAAVHAGWRGLAAGVIEAAVARMDCAPGRLMAWMGPAIGPMAFEVGDEVRERFRAWRREADQAFVPSPGGRWLADIYQLARQRLTALGVERVSGGECCTFSDAERFFSYRRDGVTGRMASLIWVDPDAGGVQPQGPPPP